LIPLCNAVGIIVGPLIGGYLAKPASQYPAYFGNWGFLIDYPYFLPCFIAGFINLFAAMVGFFFLEETLASKKTPRNLPRPVNRNREGDIGQDLGSDSGCDESVTDPAPKIWALFTPSIISLLLGSLLVFFQMSSLATLVPLFAYTRFEDGGLGLNLRQMGTVLTTNGLAAVIVQTMLFPYLHGRWGTMRVFRTVLLIWPTVFGLLPLVRWLVRERREKSDVHAGATVAMVGLIVVLALKSFGKICILCLTLLVNSAAPSASTYGALNGLAQTGSELARTLAPFITGALFSISIDKQYVDGNLVWLCGILLSCVTSSWPTPSPSSPARAAQEPGLIARRPSDAQTSLRCRIHPEQIPSFLIPHIHLSILFMYIPPPLYS